MMIGCPQLNIDVDNRIFFHNFYVQDSCSVATPSPEKKNGDNDADVD